MAEDFDSVTHTLSCLLTLGLVSLLSQSKCYIFRQSFCSTPKAYYWICLIFLERQDSHYESCAVLVGILGPRLILGPDGITTKCPISLGSEGNFLNQFIPGTIELHPLYYSDDQFAPFIPKLAKHGEKLYFRQTSYCSLNYILTSPCPIFSVKFVILLQSPIKFSIQFD